MHTRTSIKKMLLFIGLTFAVTFTHGQRPGATVDVIHYGFEIRLNDSTDFISGSALLQLVALSSTRDIYLDLKKKDSSGKGMEVSHVMMNDSALAFTQDRDTLHISLQRTLQRNDTAIFRISYGGIPADGLIISKNKFGDRSFFADNWPNRGHNWLPCVDHPADKATVDFIITAPERYQVICNGIQTEETNTAQHLKITRYHETTLLPTKEMAIGVAAFAVQYVGDAASIPIYSWVYPQDRDKGFYDYGSAKEILPWFISHVGPYAYQKLANVESKTRFGGAENANAIFYTERLMPGDRKTESLLVHEIAHQWFGNSATEKDWQHLWLSEGFATYMTHLYLENKYGVDTLRKRMKTDRDAVIAFSKKKNNIVVDTTAAGNFMELLNANSYQKGGWFLHMLRRKLGDSIFWKGIRSYYQTYAGRNASTEDFEQVIENVAGEKLDGFFHQWLYMPGQPKLAISWRYDMETNNIVLTIQQLQSNLFDFRIVFAVVSNGKSVHIPIQINNKVNTFKIPCKVKPQGVIADPETDLLFEEIISH